MNTTIPETEKPSSRRAMIGAGVAMAAAAAATLVTPQAAFAIKPSLDFSDIPGTGDVKVLNYALALEDLEADLYVQALYRLTGGGTNELGINIAGLNVSGPDVEYIQEFSRVEREHRDLLRSTLGNDAISPFRYNFFLQNATRAQVVTAIYRAENTGAMAYLGAIKFLQVGSPYLQIAGAIQGTEARHTAVVAAILRQLTGDAIPVAPGPSMNNAIDKPLAPVTVLARVSPFIYPKP